MYFNISDGRTSLARGQNNQENLSNFQYLKYGEVISIDDEFGLGRIKVRVNGATAAGGDKDILNSELPYAFPLLPKHLQIIPRVGEMVWVFVFDKNRQHVDRIYIGPITSQLNKLNFDEARLAAMAGFTFGPMNPSVNVDSIPQLKGIFPDKEDISIQGRFNTDITQKRNEIVLRAGKFETSEINKSNPYPFIFNTRTQGFLQIKNDAIIGENKLGTISTLVSNKINLITHGGGSPRFDVTNQDDLISDIEMKRILTEAHQLPFGDILLEYLILMKNALFNHVHNGSGNSATDLSSSGNKQSLGIFKKRADDLEKSMLSKNIRIN
jgi:hypothetical protein